MNTSIKVVLISLLISFLAASCSDCESVKVGEIAPPDRYYDFLVHEEGEVVQYETSDGSTLSFTIDTVKWEGRVNFKEIGKQSDTQNGTYYCYSQLVFGSFFCRMPLSTSRVII